MGEEPAIQDLQNLCKDDYNYDTIVNPSGMYIADDVRTLPENDCAVLEPQGIKSLAILPLYQQDKPIGYVGYDDCQNTRRWSREELTLLKGISSIVSSLIIRRNAETEIQRNQEALQTISDNIDSVIYVNDIETYEIKFVNRTLAGLVGMNPGQLIGRKCWQVLQKDMDGPCPFCPMPKLLNADGEPCGDPREWEHRNTVTGGWYWVKDSIIPWTDGKLTHFEVAIDITLRKQYEDQLHYYASTDAMTGVFSREWGDKLLQKEHENAHMSGAPMSLCFLDLDGLKEINDVHGHEIGDEAIHNTCKAIKKRIRKDDMFCRWGGDEFIVLLKCKPDIAGTIMRKMQDDLLPGGCQNSSAPQLSFSYGVTDFTAAASVDDAVAVADALMYENKKAKRARQ